MSAVLPSTHTGAARTPSRSLPARAPVITTVIADAALAAVNRASASHTASASNGPHRWRHLLPWLLPAVLIGIWQFFSETGRLPAGILPAPSDVFRAAWRLAERGELQRDILVSLRRVSIGLFIGASTGLFLGLSSLFAVGTAAPCRGTCAARAIVAADELTS